MFGNNQEILREENRISLNGYAKINLALDVVGRRPDGYHKVRMIMQQIRLHDRITIEKSEFPGEIYLEIDRLDLPADKNNIAHKAAALMMRTCGIEEGVNIYIEKNIPVAAGLAGGSADGAAVLVGMNELFELGLKEEELRGLGLQIGADVPFCIMGGAALAEGIGEILTPIHGLKEDMQILLCKPPIEVSTKEVYQHFSERIAEMNRLPRPDIDACRASLAAGSEAWMFNAINVLEYITADEHPEIQEICEMMSDYDPKMVLMSGSGPTVFGLFGKAQQWEIRNAYEVLRKIYPETYITNPKS